MDNVDFQSVQKSYLPGLPIKCMYKVSPGFEVGPQDHVVLYPAGWENSMKLICSQAAGPLLNGTDGCVTFPENQLPKENDDFYQFCYIRGSSTILGASTLFQFKGKSDEAEMVEEEGEDGVLVLTKQEVLQRDLRRAYEKIETLLKTIEDMTEMQKKETKLHLEEQELARQQTEKLQQQCQKAQDHIRELDGTVSSQSTAIEEMKDNFHELEMEKEKNENKAKQQQLELQQQLQSKEEDIEALKAIINRNNEMMDLLKTKNSEAAEDLTKLKRRCQENDDEKVRQESHVESLKKELSSKTEEAQRLFEKASKCELQLQQMDKQIAHLKGIKEQEKLRLLEENGEIRARLKDHLVKEVQLQNQLDAAEASKILIRKEVETIKEALAAQEALSGRKLNEVHATHSQKVQELQERCVALQEQKKILAQRLVEADKREVNLQAALGALTVDLEETKATLQDCQGKNVELHHKVESLEEMLAVKDLQLSSKDAELKDVKQRLSLAASDHQTLLHKINKKNLKLQDYKEIAQEVGRTVSPNEKAKAQAIRYRLRGLKRGRKPLVEMQNASQCVRLNAQPGKEGGKAHHHNDSVPKTPEQLLAACQNIYPNPYISKEVPTAGDEREERTPLWLLCESEQDSDSLTPNDDVPSCMWDPNVPGPLMDKTKHLQPSMEQGKKFPCARANAQSQCRAENIASCKVCPHCKGHRPEGLCDASFLAHVETCSERFSSGYPH